MSPALPALDLNADLGEGTGRDEALMEVLTSANVACGGHTGDESTMRAACALAGEHGVHVGAHPSYPDRENSGRAATRISGPELRRRLAAQVAALVECAALEGVPVRYLKPHGALYHRVAVDPGHAAAIVGVAAEFALPLLLAPPALAPGAALARAAAERGVHLVAEGFADRGYLATGGLVPRGEPGDLLHDPVRITERILDLVRTGDVTAVDGTRLPLPVRSICVHSDTPEAVAIARRLAEALTAAGLPPRPFTR
ncbi:5-oxoprolinase subunit PxpA [Pseudactinotalea sp. HY160]|uniref:5-oxoprolinase subunit PxpA n=1 Tax=Pseudactinotalea sp. HY160 TaxID=2654490 RepID=UPI00130FAEF2|nr:5-oxoprolinase subunit PxpA [Pseudactinotalea sp. HY160]